MPALSSCELISNFSDFMRRASINFNLLFSGHRAKTVVASSKIFLSTLLIVCFFWRWFLIEPFLECILEPFMDGTRRETNISHGITSSVVAFKLYRISTSASLSIYIYIQMHIFKRNVDFHHDTFLKGWCRKMILLVSSTPYFVEHNIYDCELSKMLSRQPNSTL